MPPPAKKARLLDDSSDESSSANESASSGNSPKDFELRVNSDYARRFEHNKKREELHRLEEKLGKSATLKKSKSLRDGDRAASGSESSGESSSESEEEDDEGELATVALDVQISATLRAIQSKDPRVYDKNITFYTQVEDEGDGELDQGKDQKPMFLRDYHRANLLNGTGEANSESEAPRTFAQEQEDLKKNILQEIDAAGANGEIDSASDGESSSSSDDFLVAKKPITKMNVSRNHTIPDIKSADKDPETFLSNFMASRAWVPSATSRFQPLESDDEEEERRAEEFEDAYNFRFEDPKRANEKLMSHARETTSKYSVRKEEPNRRKKQRDAEHAKVDLFKQEREEDRARLRKLKIDELETKVKKIKTAAGLSGSQVYDDDWAKFLEDGWDDEKWEQEMARRFDDVYYAEKDYESDDIGEEATEEHPKKTLKKPKWDDDIDIKDLVSDFGEEEDAKFSLSDEDEDGAAKNRGSSKSKKKQRLQEENDLKRQARKDRKKIEQIVDQQLNIDLLPSSSKQQSNFRYRETSPLSYGMTANDILMADDSQLNQYAGLKKLASFRDTEKKRKDQKTLGKKARLRQWRKETFGDESGPRESLADYWKTHGNREVSNHDVKPDGVDIREGGKKRKRSKKGRKEGV